MNALLRASLCLIASPARTPRTSTASTPSPSHERQQSHGCSRRRRHLRTVSAFLRTAPLQQGSGSPLRRRRHVLNTVLEMIEGGATIGVATDHVIESFRNGLWPGYKTGDGIEPALLAQFHPLEDALSAMGVAVWPMVELEADDALASAARIASEDARVEKVCIWTPDKDLAQCVRGDRIVQIDRKSKAIRDADAVRQKFGVDPGPIPDFLALVGDPRTATPASPVSGRFQPRDC